MCVPSLSLSTISVSLILCGNLPLWSCCRSPQWSHSDGISGRDTMEEWERLNSPRISHLHKIFNLLESHAARHCNTQSGSGRERDRSNGWQGKIHRIMLNAHCFILFFYLFRLQSHFWILNLFIRISAHTHTVHCMHFQCHHIARTWDSSTCLTRAHTHTRQIVDCCPQSIWRPSMPSFMEHSRFGCMCVHLHCSHFVRSAVQCSAMQHKTNRLLFIE